MDALGAAYVSPSLLAPSAQPTAADMAKRTDIEATARKFEASFLSIMMQQMFEGVSTEAPFGGGQGEAMFRSFMTDAIAKQMSKAGGIGLSASVTKEILKMQGME